MPDGSNKSPVEEADDELDGDLGVRNPLLDERLKTFVQTGVLSEPQARRLGAALALQPEATQEVVFNDLKNNRLNLASFQSESLGAPTRHCPSKSKTPTCEET
jgi:hypothetical protein